MIEEFGRKLDLGSIETKLLVALHGGGGIDERIIGIIVLSLYESYSNPEPG